MTKSFIRAVVPLISAVIVLSGTLYAVGIEFRHHAAADAYALYVESIILSAKNPANEDPKKLDALWDQAQATLLLHASDNVIAKVAKLEDSGGFKCDPQDEKVFTPFYDVLKAMKDHVGDSNNLTRAMAHTIFC